MDYQELIKSAMTGEWESLKLGGLESSEYKCEACHDTGWLHFEDESGYRSGKECVCRLAVKAERLIRRSGLQGVMGQWTFDSFITETPTQKQMKLVAEKYLQAMLNGERPWLYMGGQVGSGKSHLCTAVCGELLKVGHGVRYMQWVTDSRMLKATVNDIDNYDIYASPYLTTEVLYIDDLFKMQHKEGDDVKPTDADIRAIFEIINLRYVQDKPTIITSEWFLTTDLMEADSGTFSRVYQKCKGFTCEIGEGQDKNYRLRGIV